MVDVEITLACVKIELKCLEYCYQCTTVLLLLQLIAGWETDLNEPVPLYLFKIWTETEWPLSRLGSYCCCTGRCAHLHTCNWECLRVNSMKGSGLVLTRTHEGTQNCRGDPTRNALAWLAVAGDGLLEINNGTVGRAKFRSLHFRYKPILIKWPFMFIWNTKMFIYIYLHVWTCYLDWPIWAFKEGINVR